MKLKDFFRRYKGKDKKGVTLVELIAVVAILAITSTASVSVFLAVRTSVYNTSKVTTDQFNVIQTEKYIRNEFQVASNIDIYPRDKNTWSVKTTTNSLLPDMQTTIRQN